jgi:glucokinase
MANKLTIGVDVGGTNLKAGLVDAAFAVVERREIETQAARGVDHVLARIAGLIGELREISGRNGAPVGAVGVGVPGPLDFARGLVFNAPNLPGWVNVPVRDRLSEACGAAILVENDANAAAYGEFVAGAGRDSQDMVLLTLGTGVGGGIVADGRVHRGAFGNAGEVGHIIVQPGGRACPCGQFGCLERYSSANAIEQRAAEAIRAGRPSRLADAMQHSGEIDAPDVAAAARAGDALAAEIWDDACRYLALACTTLQHIVNPRVVVLGGGLINAGAQLLVPVRRHLEALTWRMADDRPRVEFATLGGDAGIIGAAAIAASSERRSTPPPDSVHARSVDRFTPGAQ